ncbi:MAG: efflux RND transporter periplasmic adaptor subunit [Bacteroidales bacterium]|nr:efflux RND transporter periplasmic adaptor subunit [Bacteroidales bacterium]
MAKKSKKKRFIIIGVVLALIVAVIVILKVTGDAGYELSINTAPVETGSVENTVTATGELQPMYKVEVGTQVSGIVQKIYVDFNSEVKKGDLLAELDRSTLQEQVNQAKSNLSTATSQLTLAQQNYDRVKQLYDAKAATQVAYEEAVNQLTQAKNQVANARSELQRAQVNISYSKIYSPISGVIMSKAVEEGQTVASSFSTPTLFTIANDPTQMQVEADVDEADIGQVKEGQNVTFTVDAFPNDVFTGTVRQVRIEPTTTSNVVTYTVIIDAPNPDSKLFPGMTANVSIVVEKEEGLVMPYEATYFTFSEEYMSLFKKEGYSIEEPQRKGGEKPRGGRPDKKKGKPDAAKEAPALPDGMAQIWVKNGKKLSPKMVKTGLDDGANVVVAEGLAEGDEVVLSISKAKKEYGRKQGSNPFMPGPPDRKKR